MKFCTMTQKNLTWQTAAILKIVKCNTSATIWLILMKLVVSNIGNQKLITQTGEDGDFK